MGRATFSLLALLGILVVACTLEPSDAEATAGTDTTTVTELVADEGDVEAYVAQWFDLRSDLELDLQSHVQEVADEQPDPPTVEFWKDVWLGIIDLLLAYNHDLESVEPPSSVASEHESYVRAAGVLFTSVREAMAGFTSLEDFEGYHFEDFFGAPKLTADHQDALYQVAVACQSLEQRLADEGQQADLVCPPVAHISVEAGAVWQANTDVVPVGRPLALSVLNAGQEAIRPVVIEILEGDPLELPVTDGVVDVSQSGMANHASFRLRQLGELQPGEGIGIRITTDFPLVVLDHRPAQFEAGAFVVIERSDRPWGDIPK